MSNQKKTQFPSKKIGKIVIIVAPSGAGKSTLLSRLKSDFPTLRESVSYTTRAKRPGEEHGKHYYFVDQAEFKRMLAEGDFLEWALVHGDYKGTSRKFVENHLYQGIPLIFDLDVQGADFFKKEFAELAQVIFIAPPSFEELEKRLRNRQTESEEAILLRLENARKELARMNDYDYHILNDDINDAYNSLLTIVKEILES